MKMIGAYHLDPEHRSILIFEAKSVEDVRDVLYESGCVTAGSFPPRRCRKCTNGRWRRGVEERRTSRSELLDVSAEAGRYWAWARSIPMVFTQTLKPLAALIWLRMISALAFAVARSRCFVPSSSRSGNPQGEDEGRRQKQGHAGRTEALSKKALGGPNRTAEFRTMPP